MDSFEKIDTPRGTICAKTWEGAGKGRPAVVIAHGFASHIDKPGMGRLVDLFKSSGFGGGCFNFHGHGKGESKSYGRLEKSTISLGVQDICDVWGYVKRKLRPEKMVFYGSSFGASCGLWAALRGGISPDFMILHAPVTYQRMKPYKGLLKVFSHLAPLFSKISPKLAALNPHMVGDVTASYLDTPVMAKDLQGCGVFMFTDSQDAVSQGKELAKWRKGAKDCQLAVFEGPHNKLGHYAQKPKEIHDIRNSVAIMAALSHLGR
ncbi:MAG: lysophospholipase [Alphaproteobacteria bacterium]|nr:lysophospholipase [Alphaproteobacteria bacterium]